MERADEKLRRLDPGCCKNTNNGGGLRFFLIVIFVKQEIIAGPNGISPVHAIGLNAGESTFMI
jgi:hypothetical protein